MSYIDLHIHSSYSDDGEFDPQKLADLCLARNIKYFSIADHNTVKGISEAKVYCKNKNIKIIPAVELDCTHQGVNLHVLGYGIDYHNKIFNEIGENIILQEQNASKIRMKLVRESGINFSDEFIAAFSRNGVVTGELIAEAAMKFDKDHKNPLLKPYYENGSRSDNPYVNFYWDYCAQGKAAYVEVNFINLNEAVKTISQNGGIPVLAHPGNNVKENIALLESIISRGIKGLEVYSSYHNIHQVLFYKKFALKHNLLITCGSDFHGKTKPDIHIGSSDCENNEDSIIAALKRSLQDNADLS